MVWKFPSVPDGKNKEKYRGYPITTILDTVILIMNLEKSHLSERGSHFLQLISSYEILLKVYRSRFSLKCNRLCNRAVDWIFMLFSVDTLRIVIVT